MPHVKRKEEEIVKYIKDHIQTDIDYNKERLNFDCSHYMGISLNNLLKFTESGWQKKSIKKFLDFGGFEEIKFLEQFIQEDEGIKVRLHELFKIGPNIYELYDRGMQNGLQELKQYVNELRGLK